MPYYRDRRTEREVFISNEDLDALSDVERAGLYALHDYKPKATKKAPRKRAAKKAPAKKAAPAAKKAPAKKAAPAAKKAKK